MSCVERASQKWYFYTEFGEYLVVQHSVQKRAVAKEPTIVVVDDDKAFRDSLGDRFNSVGLKVKLFGVGPRSCSKANCYLTW